MHFGFHVLLSDVTHQCHWKTGAKKAESFSDGLSSGALFKFSIRLSVCLLVCTLTGLVEMQQKQSKD